MSVIQNLDKLPNCEGKGPYAIVWGRPRNLHVGKERRVGRTGATSRVSCSSSLAAASASRALTLQRYRNTSLVRIRTFNLILRLISGRGQEDEVRLPQP